MPSIRPNLAARYDKILEKGIPLKGPFYASTKVDGIRILSNGFAQTRSGKEIPNKHIREFFEQPELFGLDGELIVKDTWGLHEMCNLAQMAFMSFDGYPEFEYHVFDWFPHKGNFEERQAKLHDWYYHVGYKFPQIKILDQQLLSNTETALASAVSRLSIGEGIMLRHAHRPYKYGRSTEREQGLIKVKPYATREATIVGFVEKMINTNPSFEDELGFLKKSKAQDGLIPAGTLGAFICEDPMFKNSFTVRGRISDPLAQEVWDHQKSYLGKMITYKYLEIGSTEDAPRNPVFHCFRMSEDI